METVKRYLPAPVKRVIKSTLSGPLVRWVQNILEERKRVRLFGPMAPLVPAEWDMFEGPSRLDKFKANGEEFLEIYKSVCGLQPDEIMLDVGSGIGRKTLGLTGYFGPTARYEAIELVPAGVKWCSERYTPRFPNFRFQLIDVYNKDLNPTGRYKPSEFRFPFDDDTFTFVMLGSVFTHLLPNDLSHYLAEIHRVMARGGRCLITYFLLNDESRPLMAAGRSTPDLRFGAGVYRAVSEEQPEDAIGYDEPWLMEQYHRIGLTVKNVYYGSWCDRAKHLI
jgi:ubiquinone/menaquinone biosynthesis C-methylase UbiE